MASTLFPVPWFFFWAYELALLISRWLGSPWHNANGYRGASLDAVAAAVGISRQGVLHYFPSKTHLLLGVLELRDEDTTDESTRTGGGLAFTVLIDRGLDIGPADYKGIPLAWQSGTGAADPGDGHAPVARSAILGVAKIGEAMISPRGRRTVLYAAADPARSA